MIENKKVLCIIPARGGSKGIPKKNLLNIGGFSLLERAILTAEKSNYIDTIIVSSDSKEIINLANSYGDYAPFVRSKELSSDECPSLPVFQDALKRAEERTGDVFDLLVVLEPPCPFRLGKHIDEALELAVKKKSSSIVSLVEVSDEHPIRIKKLSDDSKVLPYCLDEPEGLRRQDQDPAYIRNTAVYVFNSKMIVDDVLWGKEVFGFEMDADLYGVNIDEEINIAEAEYIYKKMKKESKLHLIQEMEEKI
tara:strand:+ start:1760 stop:2512 length:753 start_codon:yes stop_codon:yes gene_type:complete